MTKQQLEEIYYLTRELRMWERELARIRESSLTSSPTAAAVRGSGVSDKVARRAERTDELERRVLEIRDRLLERRDSALEFINAIPDSFTRQIVYHRCVDLMSWRRVAVEVGGNNSEDGVRMAYNRFVDKLTVEN